MPPRPPLNRERIVQAAVAVADRSGLGGVSMRTVGRELGVEAMSLYHHLSSKDDLLDELADWVFTLIETPTPDQPWRPAMTAKASSARSALGQHPWALGLIESRRAPGPALLGHHDGVLGCLRRNDFPTRLAMHAFSAIDAYVYGFVLTEQHLPMEPGESAEDFAATVGPPADVYPHLAAMIAEQVTGGDFVFADEFDFGLTLVLDGLAEHLRRSVSP